MAELPEGYTFVKRNRPALPEGYRYADEPQQEARAPAPSAPSPTIGQMGLEVAKNVGLGVTQNISGGLKGAGAAVTAGRPEEVRDLAAEQEQQMLLTPEDNLAPIDTLYPHATDVRENFLFRAGKAVEKFSEETLQPQKGVLPRLVEDVAKGAGQLVGQVGMAMIPGVGVPLVTGSGALQGMGEAAERAAEKGATPQQQARAASGGIAAGATEFVDGLLPQLGVAGKTAGVIQRIFKKALVGAGVEGVQEGTQEAIQNVIERHVYNPQKEILNEDVFYSALVGAIVGGGAKPALDKLSGVDKKDTPATEEDVQRVHRETLQVHESDDFGAPLADPAADVAASSRARTSSQAAQEPAGQGVEGGAAPAEQRPWEQGVTAPDEETERRGTKFAQPRIQEEPEWYYSQVERVAREKLPSEATPEQVWNTLRNSPGVKEEELEWLGVRQWLDNYSRSGANRTVVSKEDLLQHLQENAIRVQTIDTREDGGIEPTWTALDHDSPQVQAFKKRYSYPVVFATHAPEFPGWSIVEYEYQAPGGRKTWFTLVDHKGYNYNTYPTLEEAQGELFQRFMEGKKQVKFKGWSLPGGTRYREIKMALPPQEPLPSLPAGWEVDRQYGVWHVFNEEGVSLSNNRSRHKAVLEALEGRFDPKEFPSDQFDQRDRDFYSSHWSEANVLGHIRAKEYTDSKGNRVLLGLEFQSDAHQKGRRVGYQVRGTKEEAQAKIEKARVKMWDILKENDYLGFSNYTEATSALRQERSAGIWEWNSKEDQAAAQDYIDAFREWANYDYAVPNLPFKSTSAWTELLVKRFLRLAVDEGYDRVAFSTSKEQIEQWGSKPDRDKGFQEYYDKILPNAVEKIAKRLGGKIEEVTIHQPGRVREFIGREDIEADSRTFKAVVLTPEMGTELRRGQPLFAKKADGVRVEESLAQQDLEVLVPGLVKLLHGVRKLGERMGVSHPIHFDLVARPDKTALGWTDWDVRKRDGKITRGIITLNLSNLRNLEEFYAILSHEFGHILEASILADSSPLVQVTVREAYNQWLKERGDRVDSERFHEMLASRNQFVVRDQLWMGNPEEGQLFGIDRMTEAQIRYWYGFDEWFAEQVARWMTTDERPLSFMDKFFAGIAKKLRDAYAWFMRQKKQTAAPHEIMTAYLNSRLAMGAGHAPWKDVYQGTDRSTKRANQLALDEDGASVDAVPMSAATVSLRTMFAQPIGLSPQAQQNARALVAHADRFNRFYDVMVSLPQLAARNLHIKELQLYHEVIQQWALEVSRMLDRGTTTLKQWKKLKDQKDQDAVAGLMDDYVNMRYRTPAEEQAGVERMPTPQELHALVRKNKVGVEGLKVFQQVVQDFQGVLQKYRAAMRKEARKISDPVRRGMAFQDIDKEINELASKPFIPIMRFGPYVARVRDQAGNIVFVEQFKWKWQRDKKLKELQGKFPGHEVQEGYIAKDARPFYGLPSNLLNLMERHLALSNTQKEALDDLRFKYNEVQSFKYKFSRQDRTPGYSKDFQRAYANFFFYGANYFARINNKDAAEAAIQDLRESAERMGTSQGFPIGAATKRLKMANYLQEHLDHMLDPKGDFAILRSFGFLMYLGFSPAAAALNLSQVVLTTYPFLAAKFGDVKAMKAMTVANAKLSTFYKKGTLASAQAQTHEELKALNEAVAEGIITEAMAPEMAAIAEGRNLEVNALGIPGIPSFHKLVEWSSKMFEMTEQYNRRLVFRAAYMLARQNPNAKFVREAVSKHKLQYDRLIAQASKWTPAEAAAFVAAKEATQETQFVYQTYGQPKYMRFLGGHARTVLIFKSFLQNMMMFQWNHKSSAIRMYIVMGFLGGMMGLPGAEELKWMMRMIGRMFFGKDFNIEEQVKKFLMAMLGEEDNIAEWGDTILHGMSRRGFGVPALMQHLGVPGPKAGDDTGVAGMIDMSRALSLGRLSPVDIDTALTQRSPDAIISKGVQQALGPVYGYPFNVFKYMAGDWGDRKNLERMLPRQLAAMSKAWRAFDEKKEVDSRGYTVVDYDRTDPWQMAEVAALALGFQPLRVTRAWDRRLAQMEAETYIDVRRNMLLQQHFQTREDPDAQDKVKIAIENFNEMISDGPFVGKKIDGKVLVESMRNKMKEENALQTGIPQERSNIPIAQEVMKLYPKATVTEEKRVR